MTPAPCRHLFTDGHQCGSPALRGEPLCFHHHSVRQPIPFRKFDGQTTPQLPAPDDFHAIQRGIGEVIRLLANEEINDRRAATFLRAFAAASQNLARAHRQQKENLASANPSTPVTDLVNHPTLGSLALPSAPEQDPANLQPTHIPIQQNQDLSPSHENTLDLTGAPSFAPLRRVGSANTKPDTEPGTEPTLQPDPEPVPTPIPFQTPSPTLSLPDELRFGQLYTELQARFREKTQQFEEEKANELAAFYEAQYEDRCHELQQRYQQQSQQPQLQLVG